MEVIKIFIKIFNNIKLLIVQLGTKILRCFAKFFNLDIIKNKIISINKFGMSLINKVKDRLYILLFGFRVGNYSNEGELLYPIVILNNKLLFEMDHGNQDRWQKFVDNMFREINWGEDKEKLYEARLNQLLEGKHFPLESPYYIQKANKRPINFYYSDSIPMENRYRKVEFSTTFTLALYEEWKKDPEFLTYVICKYFTNYVFETLSGDYSIISLNDINIMNNLMTLDLSPFFIYQEQANSVADNLSVIFKEDLTDLNYTFSDWINQFINNLKNNSFLNLPFEKNKNFSWIGLLLF
jgi:hypothetical protein